MFRKNSKDREIIANLVLIRKIPKFLENQRNNQSQLDQTAEYFLKSQRRNAKNTKQERTCCNQVHQ